ncbi:MAG: excinuclease ABC subunit UvrA [Anaerolineales bacterium]|nr:excinuclease ABC subunit UvrA [Anaerolineales bacterium]
MENKIKIVGAKVHNLKNISVEIPRDKFVVITGLSGSGKSSLAFDTIFAEGQRRYVESLSSYARQFLGQMDKPDVEYIEGLSPAVSIDQRGTSQNPRSTVGTVTEIYDYLRLLYARAGIPHCPECGREVTTQSAQEIVDLIEGFPEGTRFNILAPVIKGRKGEHQGILEEIQKSGFVRARIDGDIKRLEEDIQLERYQQHTIEAVVDRLVIQKFETDEEQNNFRSRLTDSVETALKFGDGYLIIYDETDPAKPITTNYSEHLACPECELSFPEIEPRTFSFNTPHGACPTCEGIGTKLEVDVNLLIPDKDLSVNDGAIDATEWGGPRAQGGYYWRSLVGAADAFKVNLEKPYNKLSEDNKSLLLYGTGEEEVKLTYVNKDGREYEFYRAFEGVINNLERRFKETQSEYMRTRIMGYMNDHPCPSCEGARLRPEALAVTIDELNIVDISTRPIQKALDWVNRLNGSESPLNQRQQIIADRVLRELTERLGFLVDVGLDYLTLSRSAGTLSGGEAQRIRLATQIGSHLMGVLYVLDEPSIGLHPRDNGRLLRTLEGLRDLGNTVMVVEHDAETIKTADWILDLGPGAGEHGGEVVVAGTIDEILKHPESLTGAYLSGRLQVPVPEKRREGNGKSLQILGAREHNLKDIDVSIPLGRLVCITGVSGSGKSTLMIEILYKALARELNRAKTKPGDHDKIIGTENIDKIVNIDQSPIGRSPRSNPGTYTKLFDHIRDLFADLQESKIRGYDKSRFSFNVKGGRCEACRGHGQLEIEMQFLPDVYVPCDVCHGKRYNRETLQVRFKGEYNIADVLDMTIDTAMDVFDAFPAMMSRLKTLQDVGLGYIRIGQASPTLSGGEAQRIKLSRELSKRSTGSTLYVLDEPSVGLHAADVHKLIEVLQRLVDEGNTVLIIEHNLDIIKVADYIIDLGPEGGDAGGEVIAAGLPNVICESPESYTGQYLKSYIKNNHK